MQIYTLHPNPVFISNISVKSGLNLGSPEINGNLFFLMNMFIHTCGSFHANWTKGVKLISQKMLKKIYVVQLAEYFNHANL